MHKDSYRYFETYVDGARAGGLYPNIQTVTGPSCVPHITIKGEQFTNFCSNNYLGLARNDDIEREMIEGVKEYGVGSGSTRLLSGTLDVQVTLEEALARYFEFDASITFSSGFLANVGVIRMLVDPFPYFSLVQETPGVIISDELNHASIIDGVRLASAERVVYKHSDMEDLERVLAAHKGKRKLVITDGVFSMDGEIARLKEVTALARAHDAILMVDDSHGVGVLGPHGIGAAGLLGVQAEVDVLMGSFTKAFGSIGGFVATPQKIADYLRVTARSYIFSDPIVPSIVRSLIKATEIIAASDDRRAAVLENARHLREGLRAAGFTVLGEITPIVPLFLGDEKLAIAFSNELAAAHILAPCVRPPAVNPGKERIRFSVMATHTAADIDTLLTVCADIGKRLGSV